MNSEIKNSIGLIISGMIALISPLLPWADGISLLQILAVIEVQNVFPNVPLSIAGTESQLLAVYVALYTTLLGSAFLLAVGVLQFSGYREEYRWIRLLSVLLLVGALLSALHYPAYPPSAGAGSYGFFLLVTSLILVVFSEYRFEGNSSIRNARVVFRRLWSSVLSKTDSIELREERATDQNSNNE